MQRIRIGQAAKMLGISQQTLRRWGTLNVITPTRAHKHAQRLYNLEDIHRILEQPTDLSTPFEGEPTENT